MAKCPESCKTRYVIKTLLCANRHKKFTAKEISEFIIVNKLHDKKSSINPSKIFQIVKTDRAYNGVLSEVCFEKINNKTYYWMC